MEMTKFVAWYYHSLKLMHFVASVKSAMCRS